MKKYRYILIAATAAALTGSCAKEIENPVEEPEKIEAQEYVTFTATTAETRTELSDGHTIWSAGDAIKVFYGSSGSATASIKTGEGTSRATFEAAVPDGSDYFAVYPASITSSKAGTDKLSVTLPEQQSGAFGAAHLAVAKGVDKAFSFANVNSFLKITLPTAGYRKIAVESPAGGALSGSMTVDLSSGAATVTIGADKKPFVEIASETGFPVGDVFISVLPGVTHEKGLLVKYYDESGIKGTFFLDKSFTTEISVIHSFGEFEVTGDYFVTLQGAGNKMGLNQANAMDLEGLKAFLTLPEDADLKAARMATLNKATFHLSGETFDFRDSLLLAYPDAASPIEIAFEGTSGTVITGNEEHRLLNLGKNARASFKDITFEKGYSEQSGNSPIKAFEGSVASFSGCVFTHCTTKKYDEGKGAMVYATCGCFYAEWGSDLSFDHCEFSYNKGSYAANLLTKGKLTIRDCHFQYNDGTWPGSALYLDHKDAACEVYDSVIENNTVSHLDGEKPDGGAIAVVHGTLTMTGCSLLNNSIPDRRGGALRVNSSDTFVKLIDCTVKGNTADWGGAINVADSGVLEIEGGTYEENYSRGGGCILTSGNASVSIKDALFKKNYLPTRGRFGGAIRHESNGPLTILRTTFEGNYGEYNGEEEAFGVAVSIAYGQKDAEVTISDCVFIGNHSRSGGGTALCYQSSGDGASGWMKVTNTLFKDNYNEYAGANNDNYARHAGAVRLGHDSTNSYFDNCTFVNNYTTTASSEIKSTYGGAVTFYSDGNAYFNNCRFENNRATRGGAISVWNCLSSGIYLNACSFSGNWISYKNGTDIFFEKAKVFCMNNCSFADNTYTNSNGENDGCWVYVNGDKDKVLEECVISNCSLIGSARTTSSLDPLSGQALVYLTNAQSGKHYYLVNNIIVAGDGQNAWQIDQSGTSNTYGYNNVYSKKAGSSAYTGTGDTEGKSASDLGALAWDADQGVWSWNGTLAGGYTGITSSAFSSAISKGSPALKTWLESIGALNKDQLGGARGNGAWWPGAYQK